MRRTAGGVRVGRGPGSGRRRLLHLRWGWSAIGVVLTAGAVPTWALSGGAGLVGYATGVGLVASGFTLSSLVIAWADAIHPPLIMPYGLMTYVAKFAAIIALLTIWDGCAWPGGIELGIGIMVAACAWCAAQVLWLVRMTRAVDP